MGASEGRLPGGSPQSAFMNTVRKAMRKIRFAIVVIVGLLVLDLITYAADRYIFGQSPEKSGLLSQPTGNGIRSLGGSSNTATLLILIFCIGFYLKIKIDRNRRS